MNVYELFKARGKFRLKHYIYAWIISARLFALPWVILYTIFGILLAGITNIERAIASCLIVAFILLSSHFNNNYKDVELGIDKYVDSIEEAEKICSTLKPYTAGAWMVPLRITSIKFQKANDFLFMTLAILTYLIFFTKELSILISSLPILLLGLSTGRLYTTFFKYRKLGEVAAFLGHGFGTTAFGFLSQIPDIITAILIGIPTGLISALAYSVDQFIDIKTDFIKRVRCIYESWFNSRMPLGLYVLVTFVFWINVVIAWVVAGIYPRGVLIVISLIPAFLFFSPQLEYNREKALLNIVIIAIVLIPLLMCIGVIIK
ncbi:MAG: hypothetical protein QW803_12140 [Candidatus Methanomethylicia archaeon]